jgi:carboxypeptidase Taq
MTAAYTQLEARFRRLNVIRESEGMLQWDLETLMPEGGAEARTEQLATLSVLAHELLTDPRVGELLEQAAVPNGLDAWQKANLRNMTREWRHASVLPASLVEARSKNASECELRWRAARPANDFTGLLPYLQRGLDLAREAATIKAQALGMKPYDALMDKFEPGATEAEITPLFDRLAKTLPELIGQVIEKQARGPKAVRPSGPFPAATQMALARRLMEAVGFDFKHGRLDTSAHPFCGGVPDDVRLTTRWDETDFLPGLMGVLHETGLAMYERGLPREWRLQPVGQALGMSVHESQSLIVEMQASRSREFIAWLAPVAAQAFGGSGPEWSAENFIRIYSKVQRGLIRVDADEVTYPAHVILRYRLELALIGGDLKLADLPGAWAEGMKTLVGIVPPDDKDGCLQDIHWPGGGWGYFPSYTLGAMTAAQLFDAARRARPEIPAALGRGDFSPLMGWLRENVHSRGSLLTSRELLTAATGKPLDHEIFLRHLRSRYLEAA